MLRAYLKRWKWEVGQFFQGVGPDAPDADLIAIAPGYPIFRLTDRSGAASCLRAAASPGPSAFRQVFGHRLAMGAIDVAAVLELGSHAGDLDAHAR